MSTLSEGSLGQFMALACPANYYVHQGFCIRAGYAPPPPGVSPKEYNWKPATMKPTIVKPPAETPLWRSATTPANLVVVGPQAYAPQATSAGLPVPLIAGGAGVLALAVGGLFLFSRRRAAPRSAAPAAVSGLGGHKKRRAKRRSKR